MTHLCPVCNAPFDDDVVLELHVHEHFAEAAAQPPPSSSASLHATLSAVSERDVLNHLAASLPDTVDPIDETTFDDDDDDATVAMSDDDADNAAPPAMLSARPAAAALQSDEDFALALALSLADQPESRARSSSSSAAASVVTSSGSRVVLPWIVPSRMPGTNEVICAPATVANVVSLCRAYVPATRLAAVFAMCSDVDHFQSRWDRGWGCGWRNLQQFVSALSKRADFARRLWHGAPNQVPTIGDLQKALENAWALGFDRLGQQQLQSVSDSRRWVGTTEMVAALRSRDINVRIAAFPRPSGAADLARLCPGAVTRTAADVHYGLVAWVVRYFRSRGVVEQAWSGTPLDPPAGRGRGRGRGGFGGNRGGGNRGGGRGGGGGGGPSAAGKKRPLDENEPQQSRLEAFGFFGGSSPRASSSSAAAATTSRNVPEEQGVLATDPVALSTASVTLATPFVPPLYLQHQGHSRTIIGYEVKLDGSVNLLILDPSTQGLFEGVRTGDLRQLRRGEATMTKRQYEIVYLHATRPLLNSDGERQAAKNLHADDVVE